MRDVIATLGELTGASVEFEDRDDPNIVIAECSLPSLPNITVCFSGVADDCLEWGLIVRDSSTGVELWSDWWDYIGYGETDIDKLKADQRRDLQAVVDDIREAEDFRVISNRFLWFLKTRKAEWLIHGQWKPVTAG